MYFTKIFFTFVAFLLLRCTNAQFHVQSIWSTGLTVEAEPFQYKFAVDACQDNYGIVYMTGSYYPVGVNGSDVFVAAFNYTGGLLSLLPLSSTLASSKFNDYSYGIACGSNKEVWIVGETSSVFAGTSNIGTIDGFVAKITLNSSNVLELTWIQRFGVASSNTSAQGISIRGNYMVVTGFTTGDLDGEIGSAGKNATFIRKMSQSSGSLMWTKLYGNSTISVSGISITLDTSDNAYVYGNTAAGTAFCAGGYSGTRDTFLIKTNSSGSLVWCNQIGSTQTDDARQILFQIDSLLVLATTFSSVVDRSGQILGLTSGSSDATLMRYSLNGTKTDATFIGSNDPDVALGISTNIAEEIYIVGGFFANPMSLHLARLPAYPQNNFSRLDWDAGFSDTTYNYMSSILGSYNNRSIFYVVEVLDPVLLASANYYLVGVLETWNTSSNSSSSNNSSATLSSLTTGDSTTSSTSTTTTTTASTTSSTTSSQNNNDNGPNSNAVVVAVAIVVSVVAISIGVAGVFFGYRMTNKRRIRQSQIAMQPEDPPRSQGASNPNDATTAYASFNSMGPIVAPSPNAEPQKKDQWEIPYSEITLGQELGKGAFGVVFLARWRSADCVVKQLDINSEDPQAVNLFLKEANNVKNLRSHPNVCTMYGVCTNPKSPICIVMEYMSEGSLWNMLTEKRIPMTLQLVVQFAKEVASGMSHLHAENILHCDLACRNILVAVKGTSYTVKVADFGLSRIIGAETYTVTNSNATFPIRWTAPETLVTRTISRANDVWSYGISLWEMAEGKYPYLEMSHNDVIQQVCLGDYRLPRPGVVQIPDPLWKLMQRCWDKNPANRPTFPEIYDELAEIENSKAFNY